MDETIEELGARLVREKKWVFHADTGVIGQAETFFDGVEKVFVSTVNDLPVKAPILTVHTGHSFLLRKPGGKEATIIELEEKEVKLFVAASRSVSIAIASLSKQAAEIGVAPDTAFLLFRSALNAQSQLLSPQKAKS